MSASLRRSRAFCEVSTGAELAAELPDDLDALDDLARQPQRDGPRLDRLPFADPFAFADSGSLAFTFDDPVTGGDGDATDP